MGTTTTNKEVKIKHRIVTVTVTTTTTTTTTTTQPKITLSKVDAALAGYSVLVTLICSYFAYIAFFRYTLLKQLFANQNNDKEVDDFPKNQGEALALIDTGSAIET